jgi:DTW domain-containing protein YfiP
MSHEPLLGTGVARCPRCLFQHRVCLCADIPRIANRTRIVIVRHHLERFRSSNSGRLAQLALANSEIVEYHGEHDTRLPLVAGSWLVYPQGEPAIPEPPPRQLVILDATWSQARRMYRKLDAVRGLPILRLAEAAMPARLRESPGPGLVSTIEAIAGALRVVEGEMVAQPLLALFQLAVERVRMTGRQTRDFG